MSNSKRTLYVGGLAEDISVDLLRSAFSAFGDIIDVNIPLDYSTQKHKGFAFIEFQQAEDAADAIDNMDNGEILGRTIRVNIAKPIKYKDTANQPIWASDDYLRKVEGVKDPASSDRIDSEQDSDSSGSDAD